MSIKLKVSRLSHRVLQRKIVLTAFLIFFTDVCSPHPLIAASKTSSEAKKTDALPKVIIATNQGNITLELYPNDAPLTTKRFLKNVASGYYSHYVFSRYVTKLIIVAVSPKSKKRFQTHKSEWKNALKHERGVVGIMRTQTPNSEGNDFYISLGKQPYLDGAYTLFGRVTEGMEDVVAVLRPGDRIISANIIKPKKKKKVIKKNKKRRKRKRKKKSKRKATP